MAAPFPFDPETLFRRLRPFLHRACQAPGGAPPALAFDASGSVGHDVWQARYALLALVRREMRVYGLPVRLLHFDLDVRSDVELREGDRAPVPVFGGGSDPEAVMQYLSESPPSVVIVLSDMMFDAPETYPGCPVLWVNEMPMLGPDSLLAHFALETLEALASVPGSLSEADLADLMESGDARVRLWAQTIGLDSLGAVDPEKRRPLIARRP